jgi:hypothetical protein
MARRDLIGILHERPIFHPTRIEEVLWRGRTLIISIRGARWWEGPYTGEPTDGEASIIFEEVGEGCLRTDELDPEFDEALEDLEVVPVSEVPWAQPRDWSIFCSGPLSEPMSVFRIVHDYLRSNEAFLQPEDILNQGADLAQFVAMTRSAGYLICRGPKSIRDLVGEELSRQATPHNVIEHTTRSWPKLLVRLGDSAFLCGSATLEWPT